MGFNQEDKV